MKNKEFYKLLKKQKANSGFTLTELLVGLIMGVIVIGAMGFGLAQVLSITQSETSRSAARNEISRAIDFVSDEMRRASKIENDASKATGFSSTGKTVVFALEIPEVSDSFGSDADDSTPERVVYYLESASGTNWRGDQVLYRYGPPLDDDGSYTAGAWGYEALIDNIDDTSVASPCPAGEKVSPASPTGFYVCIVDDDGDNITENLTDSTGDGAITSADAGAADLNGDGVIDDEDGADEDGDGITAQLFFTGLTNTVTGVGTNNYTADTKAVARASEAPENDTDIFASYTWSFKDLGGEYQCDGSRVWGMRTDFNAISWERNTNRQPQPITIDSSVPLTITSNPTGETGCNSSDVPVDHEIDFSDPTTFNGDILDSNDDIIDSATVFTDDDNDASTDRVETERVQFFKKGSTIGDYGGFDVDGGGIVVSDDSPDQPSLGRFLYEKGYAKLVSGNLDDDTGRFEILDPSDSDTSGYPPNPKFLGDDERIIAFEVGDHADTTQPGFDLQDNIFIVASDVFKKQYKEKAAPETGYEVVSN